MTGGSRPGRGSVAIGVASALVVAVLFGPWTGPAAAATGTPVPVYDEPVDAPVVDGFRPPSHPYGPGNRGLEYGVRPGQTVTSAAAGRVTFAGRIGAHLYVTVAHLDRVRTTYSYLSWVAVAAGEWVDRGHLVGRTGPTFHFGARIGSAYVDPAVLLAGGVPGPPRVELVPGPAEPGGCCGASPPPPVSTPGAVPMRRQGVR